MTKLTIAPDANGYKVTPKNTFIAKQMTYGNMRRRREFDDADFFINMQWTLDLSTFNTLSTFFIENAGATFQIDILVLSAHPVEYNAKLVPDSFKINSQQGDVIVCSATLAVLPDQTELDCYDNIVAIQNCLNGQLDPTIRQLNLFFNDINKNTAILL